MSDLEIVYDSDHDVSEHHSKLVEAVAQLDKGQRVKKAERSEPTLEVSEYHLVKSGITDNDAVQLKDLVKSLGKKGYQRDIVKKLRSAQQKTKILPTPLEKPAAERIKRIVGFKAAKKEVGKWSAIIARNRRAEHLFFPLTTPKEIKKDLPTTQFLKRFRLKSDLEKKLEELDPTPQEPPVEEKDKYQMTLEEVMLKRKEAARLRAQQSYKEAKAHRQRKIKSKKFHRIQRKEKVKQQLKEFEELQKTNPEEALLKLEQLDKSRAEERMSLRHKSTGQWAKNKQIRAKYNKEARQVLAEQLAISRELTQKVKRGDNSDEENEEGEEPLVLSNNDKENPWMNNVKTESEIDDFVKSYREYCDEKKSQEEKVVEIVNESKSSIKKHTLDNKLEKQNSDKLGKQNSYKLGKQNSDKLPKQNSDKLIKTNSADNNIVTFAKQKIKESDEVKKVNKKANTHCTIISDTIISKKVKLCNRKNATKSENLCEADATSTWQVEKLKCNGETDKISKLQDIDDMFDSMHEKLKRKADLKLQKMKKKLKPKVKTEKRKEQRKKKKDDPENLEFKESKRKPILDLPLEETSGNPQQNVNLTSLKIAAHTEQESADKSNGHIAEIDPQKYLNVKPKHLKTQIPDLETGGDDVSDDGEQEETHRIMSEAFADDDVVEEFRKEKEEEIKKSQSETIDLSLPGWGSWAGANIKKSKVVRKKRRFILKFPKEEARKDENKGDVIVFEGDDEKLKPHLVSELPYPFTSVKDFEASIRAPLGRTFLPENAHMRLVQPSVYTKLGQVIEPMTEDVLVKKQPELKRRKANNKKDTTKNNKKKRT